MEASGAYLLSWARSDFSGQVTNGVGGGVGMDLAAGGGVCQCAAEQVDDQQRGASASAEGWYPGTGRPEQQLGHHRAGRRRPGHPDLIAGPG